jgi:hypothetical protein
MANAFTNFLGQALTTTTQVKDYQHASRLYVDDYFRLAPNLGSCTMLCLISTEIITPLLNSF